MTDQLTVIARSGATKQSRAQAVCGVTAGVAVFAVFAAKKQRADCRKPRNSLILEYRMGEITARNLAVFRCKSSNNSEAIHKML
jgi:hypothetical protein